MRIEESSSCDWQCGYQMKYGDKQKATMKCGIQQVMIVANLQGV